jgi:integrase
MLRRRRAEQAEHRLLIGTGWPHASDEVHGDLVFTKPDGSAIDPSVLTRVIARLSERAGLRRITAHGLRHSAATAGLLARYPVEVVAHRLGNSPRVVQEVYAHVIPSDDHAAAKAVGDLYRSAGNRPR